MCEVIKDTLASLQLIVGEKYATSNPDVIEEMSSDWSKYRDGHGDIVVYPGSREEVSKILTFCHEKGVRVVPSGGRTGLAGGASAKHGEIILSLNRMNKILNLDTVGLSIEAEAGVTTQALQEAAEAQGLLFPLDLAAKGSSQIGGNLATNAGGLRFVKYGGAREQVLGLEVVLANGEFLDLNTDLRKDNCGYDLKQLFVGSEGTLGVITKATLRLMPPFVGIETACIGCESMNQVLSLFELAQKQGLKICAFEFFTQDTYEAMVHHFRDLSTPFEEIYPFYVLLEVEGLPRQRQGQGEALLLGFLEQAFEKEVIMNAVFAESAEQRKQIWDLRENITESLAAQFHVYKNDVSLPISKLSQFYEDLAELIVQNQFGISIFTFGHVGDGNIHINYCCGKSVDKAKFLNDVKQLEVVVFSQLKGYKGSISAEHGIGVLKKKALLEHKSALEIALMKQIKSVLDPKGILNSGKIFD